MEAKVYSQKGKETGKIKLSEGIFDLKWNGDLVHQVLTSMTSNARASIAHTKDRSEVRGGGKKPWQQKGTGRARHGSRRSPIWRTGGITFGPRNEKNYDKKINKKMRVKALFSLLSEKFRTNEVLFIDEIKLAETKTSLGKEVLSDLSKVTGFEMMKDKKKNSVVIYLSAKDEMVSNSFNNFGNVEVMDVHNMNVLDVATYKYVIIVDPKKSTTFLESKLSK